MGCVDAPRHDQLKARLVTHLPATIDIHCRFRNIRRVLLHFVEIGHNGYGLLPMARIKVSDSIALSHPAGMVHFVLHDFRAYDEWWPKPLRITLPEGDDAMRIQNGPLVSWTATVTEVKPEELIRLRYEGSWIGEACWIISPTPTGCTVEYRVDIEPRPLWLRFLQKIVNLGKRHSHQMQSVFRALEQRVDRVAEGRRLFGNEK
jgi:uncharacterized protein YndB with AHSA1/START domain